MKHFIIVLLAGLITFTIVLMIYRPDILEDVWLWIVGLSGTVIGVVKALIKKIEGYLQQLNTKSDVTH